MLDIYISAHCRGCDRALELARRLRVFRPDIPLNIIDIDRPGSEVPQQVIGTPTYVWGGRILFMGNPSEEELLERIDGIYRRRS